MRTCIITQNKIQFASMSAQRLTPIIKSAGKLSGLKIWYGLAKWMMSGFDEYLNLTPAQLMN